MGEAQVTSMTSTTTTGVSRIGGLPADQPGVTDDNNILDQPPAAVQEIAVVFTTFVTLAWLKVLVYVCITRTTRLARLNHTRSCWIQGGGAGAGTTTCHCRSSNRLPWYISNLAVDIFIYPLLTFLGFYGLHCTNVLDTPLCGGETPSVARYMVCMVLGSLLIRPILALCGPGETCRFKMSLMYSTFGITMYISILVTGENSILAFVGMISQLQILCQTVRQVVVNAETSSCLVRFANSLKLTVIAVCSILSPVVYVCYAISRQAVGDMTYYSVAVFAFSVAFFGIAAVATFVHALVHACSDLAVDTSETQGLLTANKTHHLTGNKTLMGPPDLTAKPKVPFTAYNFTFPTVDTA